MPVSFEESCNLQRDQGRKANLRKLRWKISHKVLLNGKSMLYGDTIPRGKVI